MIPFSPPSPLSDRIERARLTVDNAQEQLYDALMLNVARLVRDTLPDAAWLLIDANDLEVEPTGVVLSAIGSPADPEMWVRGHDAPAALDGYQTSDGVTWPDVVSGLEELLTDSMGAFEPDIVWDPCKQHGPGMYHATLPSAEDIAESQEEQPHLVTGHLKASDHTFGGGFWHAAPAERLTMSVAGVAITAHLGDDDVLNIDVSPAVTQVWFEPPTWSNVPVRVHISQTPLPPPKFPRAIDTAAEPDGDATAEGKDDGAGDAGQEEGDDEEPASCRTEQRDGNPDDGEGRTGLCGDCADHSSARSRDTTADATRRTAPTVPSPITGVSQLERLLPWFDRNGKMDYDPDSDGAEEHNNSRRAGFAATAVVAHARRTGQLNLHNDEEPGAVIGDVLCDLRHLADALNLDFNKLDLRGEGHYEAEIRGEG